MHITIKHKPTLLHFQALPAYAHYLLSHHLEAFCRYQLELFKTLNVPLLRAFAGVSDAQLLQFSMQTNAEYLTLLARNAAQELIDTLTHRWQENALPQIDKHAIVTEDITYTTYAHKQTFRHFITGYTSEAADMLHLLDEIDVFLLAAETAATNLHVALLKEELSDSAHLLQKINNTLPGAVYVFDVPEYKNVYANDKLGLVIGYTEDELNKLGKNALETLVHPDDVTGMKAHLAEARQLEDGKTKAYKYRVRGKDGVYHWICNYETPFKRNAEGNVQQTIGFILNIDTEQQLAQALEEREAQYKKAEALANLGHYSYDLHTKKLEWTDQLYHIYGLAPQSETVTLQRFLSFIHPADKEAVIQSKDRLFIEKKLNYTFRILTATGEEKTVRSIAEVQEDAQGNAIKVIGTEQDITEKHKLIEQLKHSEALYKQAQALAHIGNWTWHIDSGLVEWSDELYRIYELPVGEKVTYDIIASYIHPEDKDAVLALLQHCVETKDTYDKYHRIVLPSGRIKTIHRRAEVQLDNRGNGLKMVGTTQDVTERQHLISQLEESERLYKQAQEIAHVGNWVIDVKTGSVSWSDEVFNIMGVAPQSVELNWNQLLNGIDGEDRETAAQVFQNAIATAQPFELFHRVVRKDGTIRILHVNGEAVTDAANQVVQLIGTAQDVTRQKQTEQELRDNQTFIQKIADATPSIIAVYNVNTGRYEFVNAGLKKLLDYDPALVFERGVHFFSELVHPDDLEGIMQKNALVVETYNQPDQQQNSNAIAEFTYRMRHQNGTYRWFQTYGTVFDRNAEGLIEHVLNISLDITEQVEAQKTIEAQEHFIRHIADASPTILYLFDVSKESFTYVNREVYYVLGYTMDEIIAMGADATRTLYHPDDFALLPERRESPKKFQHTDSMIQYECRLRAKEGQWCWLLVREVIFETGDQGNPVQILGAAIDITRRKDMEKTLLQNSFLLEQSNANLEEFAYVASHDLKEPLRKISTFGDRLVNTQLDKLTEDGKIYLTKIIDASQRMQVMINDLLSISMITGDRSFQMHSLQAILEEVLQTLEYKIEQKGAVVEADALPDVRMVPSQFRQLFQNLISNSLKFVREEVQPHISIKHAYLKPEEVPHLEGAPRYLKLEFADNGIGFEEEYAQKIFAIFQRLHGRSEYEGTGIGLAICKKIVEHHGGIIYAAGRPNEGATFTVILPA